MVPIISIIICVVFTIFSNINPGGCGSSTPPLPLAPGLYVFGDSIVDNGNNNLLITLAKANYPPYGSNFPKGPTGRFTNGKTVADFAAEYLGLPYPPPYVSSSFQRNSMTGYNYASGSCGILPQTGLQRGKCLNLEEQIRLFGESVTTVLAPKLEKQEVSQHLVNSIFLFVVGSNDYLGNYFGSFSYSSQRYNPQQFAQLLLHSLSLMLKKVYELGGRKLMVSDIGPLGCLPSVVQGSTTKGRCDENMNDIVRIYNSELPSMLNNLSSTLQGSHFVLIQSYQVSYDAILNPAQYGLSDSRNSCCVTAGEVAPTCIVGQQPCPDPNKHFFWDQVHPTEAAYSIFASRLIHGSSPTFPMNLDQLLHI